MTKARDIANIINDANFGGTLDVTGVSTLSGLAYPSSDGSANQFIKTNGSGALSFATVDLTALSATNLTSGTVPSARVSGAYTGITSVGTLTGFTSTGIDDNADATAITIDSNEDITITKQGTNTTDLRFANSTNSFGGNIKYDHNSGIMKFDVHNSERMTINASGKVGIGDSSPLGNKVHIRTGGSASSVNATAGLVLEDDDSTRCDLQFIGPDGTFQSILFGDVSDDDIGKIAYSHTGNSMRFTVNASERMRIDSSGNLGLGTSSPDSRLDVATGANGAIFRYDSASTFLQILPEDANGDISLRYRANSGSAPDLLFKNDGGTEQMRLTSGGDLLVNTTTDTSGGFSVQTISNNTTATRMLAHGFSVRNNWGTATNLGNGIFSPAGSALAFSTASTERMRIDSSGLMINTSTAFNHLNGRGDIVVGDGSSNGGMTIFTGSSNQGSIVFADGTSGDQAYRGMVEYDHSNDTMAFKTAATERMRLTSGGAMTMGTTSSLTDVSGITLKHDDAGNFPTMMFLQNQPGSGGTMGSQIHMGYASDYGTILRFYGNPFNSRPGGLQVRRVTGSGTSDISMNIGTNGSLNVQGVYDQTTSSGANVNVASDGHIRRSTSSLRYKNTIKDATHGLTELLKLRSVTYKGNNDGDTVFGGLIAEEVHDAGLIEFVQYNEDNQPDALSYGNMVSLCIKAIQELKAENTALTNRITALEGA